MREGKQCGFKHKSGVIPLTQEKGISSWGNINPITPFWEILEVNLSPNSGIRVDLILILTIFFPSSFIVIMTVSTTPASVDFKHKLSSLLVIRLFIWIPPVDFKDKSSSPFVIGMVIVFPAITSLASQTAPTWARPSASSIFSYPWDLYPMVSTLSGFSNFSVIFPVFFASSTWYVLK